MSVVYENTLKKDVSSANPSSLYIIFGDDGYLKKNYVNKIISKTVDKDDIFNLSKFDSDFDLQEAYDSLTQIPLMADKKCVVICDYDYAHCDKSDFEKLKSLFNEANESAVLIIWFESIPIDLKKNTKFNELIACAEKNKGLACCLNHRTPAELYRMLMDGAKKRGCIMNSQTAKYLTECVGDDIDTLKNELEKLCYYVKNGTIDKETIDIICPKTIEASIFDLSTQIFACNTTSAIEMLDDLCFMRIEPIIILNVISSSYVDLYRVLLGKENGLSVQKISSDFSYGSREFVLNKIAVYIKKFDINKLSLSFSAITDADNKLKSFGNDSKIILEQLIIRLCYIIMKGEAVD